jgi:signal transduction histidine kinase
MWGFPALICALLASALVLRRWPLIAVAVTAGSIAVAVNVAWPTAHMASRLIMAGTVEIVPASAAAIEICYMAATRIRRVSATGVAMIGACLLIPGPDGLDPAPLRAGVALVTIIAWLIGNTIRQAHAQAELVRAQAATQTAMAERLRIARELHDMVAHSISIITIQAGAGHRVFDACPAEARDALAAIEATGRETLTGLRRMVTGLRRAEPEPRPGQVQLGPEPGLADIDRLAATAQDAGVRVEVDWRGSREPLPADIDLSAFRIIQEAVTNVVRHAGAGHCQVSIDQQDGQLSIEVTDGGHGGTTAATGYGITGMRERAALLGGDFSAGPRPAGGFRVAARLPVPASAP